MAIIVTSTISHMSSFNKSNAGLASPDTSEPNMSHEEKKLFTRKSDAHARPPPALRDLTMSASFGRPKTWDIEQEYKFIDLHQIQSGESII